ncbi:hypothetical protein BASA81_002698 [Batrachochytrium salamandrivorans]|nr:hypothetical protein BASA81_002698 [Batrachochytrium salamandrivorans]
MDVQQLRVNEARLRSEVKTLKDELSKVRATLNFRAEELEVVNANLQADVEVLRKRVSDLHGGSNKAKAKEILAVKAAADSKDAVEKWKELDGYNLRFFQALAATELVGTVVQRATGCEREDIADTIKKALQETQDCFVAGDWNFYVGIYNTYHNFRNGLCHTSGPLMWKCGENPPVRRNFNDLGGCGIIGPRESRGLLLVLQMEIQAKA